MKGGLIVFASIIIIITIGNIIIMMKSKKRRPFTVTHHVPCTHMSSKKKEIAKSRKTSQKQMFLDLHIKSRGRERKWENANLGQPGL